MAVRTWKRRLIWLAAVAIVTAIAALGLYRYAQSWAPARETYPMQGVELSADQGTVEWPTLKARGVDFAYLRATSGEDGRDPAFPQHWQDAEAAGIGRGAVHVYNLCRTGHDQATNFIATVPREQNALPPAIEFAFQGNCAARPSRDALVKEIETLVEMIEAHAGKNAILHISPDFEDSYRLATAIDRNLWLSREFLPPAYGGRPWVMWQASAMRQIEGIDGPVNWNVIRA
ncbi:GH25 family lysozyme [Sphingobium boeckii]|uniref:Lysozyme n=1 Tax=Sphingobium boeckii TaxID=1082345 RepID=A0A7W9AGJ0_9SPHN|nr:GH25 family lysozyme [Sphingobium boeckii]MBB5685076.1 lysozyme [Sphingobium boeckii]